LLLAVFPIGILLFLQYESIVRQQKAIRDLTVANLMLSGESVAAQIEADYREQAGHILRGYARILEKQRALPALSAEKLQRLLDPVNSPEAFDRLFVVHSDGFVFPASAEASLFKEQIPLLTAQYPGEVFPLGVTGPPAAQFFYMENAPGQYVIVSVRVGALRQKPQINAPAYGVADRVRIVSALAPALGKNDVTVGFPTLFPFWRLAISPIEAQNHTDSGILIFAALTSGILILFGVGLALLIRANWRRWRLTQLKEEVIRDVSHDLRMPVANISLHSEMLFSGGFTPHQVQRFHRIVYGEAQRLTSLIGVMLEPSRRRRDPALKLLPCDLRPAVEESVSAVAERIRSRGFHIDLALPESLPLVCCDPVSIARCLENLLDNAVKYSGDSRRIEVRAELRRRYVSISVRDYGIGIGREHIPHIFEEFYRAGGNNENRAKNGRAPVRHGAPARADTSVLDEGLNGVDGYGLGLSLVKSIIEAHRGKVEVTSPPNGGSSFVLLLPL
jgi:signal transduction histidine kinase